MSIQLITFDLDDTLWDTAPVIVSAEAVLREWLSEHAPNLGAVPVEHLWAIREQVLANEPGLKHRISALRRRVLFHALARPLTARDREIANPFSKDAQITAINGARTYLGDKLMRTAKPHRLLDPAAGPLIGVRLHILTRKTLGGLHTDLEGRVLNRENKPVPGLYAAGEVSGFGGGGWCGR